MSKSNGFQHRKKLKDFFKKTIFDNRYYDHINETLRDIASHVYVYMYNLAMLF